jgi:hypothetical protein
LVPSGTSDQVMMVGSPWPSPPPERAVDVQRLLSWKRFSSENIRVSKASTTSTGVPGAKHAATPLPSPRASLSIAAFHSGRIAS